MTKKDFCAMARKIATEYDTRYAMGAWGGFLNPKVRARVAKNSYNTTPERAKILSEAPDTVCVFDCVGLIKTILWGWCGDTNPTYSYGGASAKSNGVPDVGADAMIQLCTDVSNDFTTIDAGEMVWMSGHCGIYLGGGYVAEATPKWDDGVQISAVGNLGVDGDKVRTWTSHGRLPWVDYSVAEGDTVRLVGVASGACDNSFIIKYKSGDVVLAEKEIK